MIWYQSRANKFNNKRTVYNGRKYDSKHEATIAEELDLLARAGVVVKIEPQKTFGLYGKNGTRVGSHRVDFLVTFNDGHQEVWEAKSQITMTGKWGMQRKLFEDNYPELPYHVKLSKGNWWRSKQAYKHFQGRTK